MSAKNATIYRFGVFEFDSHTAELRKNGVKVKLQDQPSQVLLKLLQCPGELVTREDLRSILWPGDTFVDFDHGLNKAIARLREALDDSKAVPGLIQTIPRRGYRLNAEVDWIPSRNGSADLEPRVTPTLLESAQPEAARSRLVPAIEPPWAPAPPAAGREPAFGAFAETIAVCPPEPGRDRRS